VKRVHPSELPHRQKLRRVPSLESDARSH
jgi:hypothetical protein